MLITNKVIMEKIRVIFALLLVSHPFQLFTALILITLISCLLVQNNYKTI